MHISFQEHPVKNGEVFKREFDQIVNCDASLRKINWCQITVSLFLQSWWGLVTEHIPHPCSKPFPLLFGRDFLQYRALQNPSGDNLVYRSCRVSWALGLLWSMNYCWRIPNLYSGTLELVCGGNDSTFIRRFFYELRSIES